MDTVQRILKIFEREGVGVGVPISKRIILDEIKSWGLDVGEIRNSWHSLIGYGLIVQRGDELILTEKGNSVLGK
ncbi:MAG: hypothetical protein SFU98_18015 [Leptospiraceae bacterium]|nr:hypothetical protein [Leptospiraceae bacterium]